MPLFNQDNNKKVISLLINLTLCISIELHTRQLKEKPTILINGIFKANKPTEKMMQKNPFEVIRITYTKTHTIILIDL